jgi:hypothetical protein
VTHRKRLGALAVSAAMVAAGLLSVPSQAHAPAAATGTTSPAGTSTHDGVAPYTGLTKTQRTRLLGIARDSWKFYADDVDPHTHLPLDNLTYAGGSSTPTDRGTYTSSANVGWYLMALVSASDLGIVTRAEATHLANQTLREVSTLDRYRGFLYQWYDTSNGQVLLNPGQGDCATTGGTFDNCSFVSNVDNGLYAAGLVEARQAFPGARDLASQLSREMDFSLFYDDRAETHCNVNRDIQGNQPTGQMFGGYYKGNPPTVGDNWTITTTTARCTPTRGSRRTSAWVGTRCPATCGGAAGVSCLRRRRTPTAPTTPTSPGRASGRWRARGSRSRTRSPAGRSRSGRGTTGTRART